MEQDFHCFITLIEKVCNVPGVAVEAQCQLCEVIGANGETVKVFQKGISQKRI